MLVPFLIMLREGMEAALIVGIVASYLKQTGRSAWMPAVWVGILLAVALSLFAGAALQLASAEFPQKAQELFEALVGLVAVFILTTMVFWMRKAARSIKAELHASIDAAIDGAGTGGSSLTQGWALVGMVFFAVAREGLESVFFLLAVFQQSSGAAAPLGALLGIAAATAVGWGIYAGGLRLDLRRFFRWTGAFVLVVAAGILAGSVRALHEAGVWNHLQTVVFDLSGVLPVDSLLGSVFAGLFGYNDAPTVGELIAYGVFLAVTLTAFLKPAGPSWRPTALASGPSGERNKV
ncbi:MAG: iron uptake transporter permease EfeU [Rhodospirillales bacterium]